MRPPIDSYQALCDCGLDQVITQVYSEEAMARTLLHQLGYPTGQIRQFSTANNFWTQTLLDIENGILDGDSPTNSFAALLGRCAQQFPGNPLFRPWHPDLGATDYSSQPAQPSPTPTEHNGFGTPDTLLRQARAWEAFDLFISYNTIDATAVAAIARKLANHGIRPWFDRWLLPPGVIPEKILREMIEKVPALTVFVGPQGLGPWQTMEVRHAVQWFASQRQDQPLIPVLLPGSQKQTKDLPLGLSERTWLEFHHIDDPVPLERLLWALKGKVKSDELMPEFSRSLIK